MFFTFLNSTDQLKDKIPKSDVNVDTRKEPILQNVQVNFQKSSKGRKPKELRTIVNIKKVEVKILRRCLFKERCKTP
jgi:hypothetical protein